MVPDPFVRKYAFVLGLAENEFRWAVINAVVGGSGGAASVAVLDRVGVGLDAVATGWGTNVRHEFEEFRADWRDHLAVQGDWERAYRDALAVNTAERLPGWSPAERVLNHLWSFVEQYQSGLSRLIDAATLFAGKAVADARGLGLLLDQGVRPPVVLVDAELAPEMGLTAPGSPFRLPTLREFIREVPNSDHAAWRSRRSEWVERHGTNRRFGEPEPPATAPAPFPRQRGELPPTTSWAGVLRVLWEKVGLDSYRTLPEDLENIPEAAPLARVVRVGLIVELALDGFGAMRTASLAVNGTELPTPEKCWAVVERDWAAKLTGCTKMERASILQYHVAAMQLALAPDGPKSGAGPTDRAAYDWLKDNGDGSAAWQLPAVFETWAHYVRAARKKVGMLKNRPRRGRGGRSIVRPDGDDPSDPGGGS